MAEILSDEDMDLVFREARTHSYWQDRDVSDVLLNALYDLVKYAPTSANCSPARIVFVKSDEAKQRLKPHLAEGNVEKTMSAPVVAIIGHDMRFHDHLPQLFPHTDAKSWFEGNDPLIADTAFRNGSLQAGYLILASRSLGLDCGPMSGFDPEGVKAEFFADTAIEPNMLVNLGYGDASKLHERSPRFTFDEVCSIL